LLVTLFRTSLHSVDVEVNHWIPTIQSGSLTVFAQGIALVFDTPSLAVLSLLISGVLFWKNHKPEGLLLLAALGGDALFVAALKALEHVARPTNNVVFDTGFSYPSGHSAGVVVFGGMLAYFAWRHWCSTRSRVLIGVGLGAVVGVVGFDRAYLSVHWLSDVLGGWLFGGFWLFFVIFVFEWLKRCVSVSERFGWVWDVFYVVAFGVAVFLVLLGVFGFI
jgi:membrane-associated phospholipid phosphatase